MYNLKYVDITDKINLSRPWDPFKKKDLDTKKFWDWNFLQAGFYNWDNYCNPDKIVPFNMTNLYYTMLETVCKKQLRYLEEYPPENDPTGQVGPLHFKIQKDGEDAYVSFGYIRHPGLYEQFFNFFIPVPNDDDQMLWTTSEDIEFGAADFVDEIGRRVDKVICVVPPKSPVLLWARKRKAFTIKSYMSNPSSDHSKILLVDCNWRLE